MKVNTKYTRSTLIAGEDLIYAAKLHNFSFFYPVILMVLSLLMMLYPLIVGPSDEGDAAAGYAQQEQSTGSETLDRLSHTFQQFKRGLPPEMVQFIDSANQVRMVVFGFLLFALACAFMTMVIIKKYTVEQAITSKKIIFKKGFIQVNETVMPLGQIEGVKVHQSVLDRIINRGSIVINGVGMEQLEIRKILYPAEFRKQAYQAIDVYGKR